MRLTLAIVALLVGATTAHANVAHIEAERQFDARGIGLVIDTPAFTAPVRVQVFLPTGYDAAPKRRWPVTYYLAGTNHDEAAFGDEYDGENLTKDYPSIVVAPRGDSGYWSDWYNGGAFGAPMYETFVIDQLVPLIDARFRTSARRSQRAVLGESMGGYGTMTLAARHPDTFVAASSLSGAVDSNLPLNGDLLSVSPALQGAAPDSIYGPRSTQEIRWRGHNPWDLAGNLRNVDLQVRTADGSLDAEGLANPSSCAVEQAVHAASVSFAQRLDALSIPHVFQDRGAGCHTAGTFEAEIAATLPTFERVFAAHVPDPKRFSYESIEPRFSIWGWHVVTDPNRPLEFLELRRASRHGVTLHGSGVTTVNPPGKRRPFIVDLGQNTTKTVRFKSGR